MRLTTFLKEMNANKKRQVNEANFVNSNIASSPLSQSYNNVNKAIKQSTKQSGKKTNHTLSQKLNLLITYRRAQENDLVSGKQLKTKTFFKTNKLDIKTIELYDVEIKSAISKVALKK